MDLRSAKKNFWYDLAQNLALGVLLGLVLTWFLAIGFHQNADAVFWLLGALTAVVTTGVAWLTNMWRTLPSRAIYESYSDLCKRRPEMIGLINARLQEQMFRLEKEIDRLSDTGEIWNATQRLAVAGSLLEDMKNVTCYLATSTDSPFVSYPTTESFQRLQKDKLKYSDAKRLLVLPLAELLKGLEEPVNRDRLQKFLNLHYSGSNSSLHAAFSGKFQLRYLPQTIQDLRKELQATTGELEPLVDFAVVGDSLVFGQRATDHDVLAVRGQGFVFASHARNISYRRAFETIWTNRKNMSMPRAQLDALNQLRVMRDKVRERASMDPIPWLTGLDYFKNVLTCIENSHTFHAIDVATATQAWFEKPEYIDFHEASCRAGIRTPSATKTRVFVLPEQLDSSRAEAFIENVLKPETNAKINIHLLYAGDLIDRDLAAVDCIFNDEWGFYLFPLEPFDRNHVSQAGNSMDAALLKGYFRQMFHSLVTHPDRESVDSSHFDHSRLKEFLTQAR